MRCYVQKNVIDAARERIGWVFDRYEHVYVSVSGGKDSTVLFELAWREAQVRGREVHAFFLDQEAEYASTIEIVRGIMSRPGVVPHWYQVPIRMTSAVSYEQDTLYAWGPGESWMREKDPLAIHSIDGDYPQRFYPFFDWFEGQMLPSGCSLVGLRAEESMNRLRAVIKSPGVEDILWSTRTESGNVKLYPIYDMSFDDIFQFFHEENVTYNRIYDFMHVRDPGEQIRKYRVSNLIHERAYASLSTLQDFEPDTYERLIRRLKGVHTAAIYAGESTVYAAKTLPKKFPTWRAYRDHLLATLPNDKREVFAARFARQAADNERVARGQCKQLLLNDHENALAIPNASGRAEESNWREKWRQIL